MISIFSTFIKGCYDSESNLHSLWHPFSADIMYLFCKIKKTKFTWWNPFWKQELTYMVYNPRDAQYLHIGAHLIQNVT